MNAGRPRIVSTPTISPTLQTRSMNSAIVAKVVPLLKSLLAMDDACGMCDQGGGSCCEIYEQIVDLIDGDSGNTDASDALFSDAVAWLKTHAIADDDSDSDSQFDDSDSVSEFGEHDADGDKTLCPCCDEPQKECWEAGGYTPQCPQGR